jgi:choline-sulfatase
MAHPLHPRPRPNVTAKSCPLLYGITTRAFWLLAIALALFPVNAALAAEKPPLNIVCILTDDQARWAAGPYGNKEVKTPNMDRLAKEGVTFLNAFVPTPVCSPSRVSYFTGRYGTQVGITDWLDPDNAEQAATGLPASAITWPSVLQKNGYRTALFGKWHLGLKAEYHPTKRGFDTFLGHLGGGWAPMNPTLEVDGKMQPLKGFSADLLTDAALKFIEANRDKPFAVALHFREPHLPYTPMPEEDAKLFKDLDPTIPDFKGLDVQQVKQWTREYYACIHAIDRNLGRVLARLDELKLSDNTIVMFQSDHGYMIGHHGLHAKGNGYWIAGGVRGPQRPNMFDDSMRIPLLIRWPGVVKPGTQIKETVCNIDTFASVLGMLGVAAPEKYKQEGQDFSPLLRGRKTPWRDTLFGQYDLVNGGLAYMRMIRTDDWKLVRHSRCNGLDELYDLAKDPGETRNLYNNKANREVQDKLQERLTAWQQSIDDPLLK